MHNIDFTTISTNAAQLIGSQWMLISAGKPGECGKDWNTMTASWGGLGFLWNKPVAYIFVRPNRHTHRFIEAEQGLTLSFMPESCRQQLVYCGRNSGSEVDKMTATGLKPLTLESGLVAIDGAELVLECRKLFRTRLQDADFIDWSEVSPRFYNDADPLHDMYICEISAAYAAETPQMYR